MKEKSNPSGQKYLLGIEKGIFTFHSALRATRGGIKSDEFMYATILTNKGITRKINYEWPEFDSKKPENRICFFAWKIRNA